jgi:glycosyltransferase involved in cell wall biosynthesis
MSLSSEPEITVADSVADVADWYRQTHVAIVPLRAGGATRIKVLEAFAYRRPVVSTTIGSEAIDARDGVHLLLADTPDQLAAACARLLSDQALRQTLSARAFELFHERYSLDAVAAYL